MSHPGSKCLFLVATLAISACAADQPTMGSVSLPVETVGSDGATYRLPANTRLAFQSMATASYDVSLDGSASEVTFAAQEGSYLATMYNTDADYAQTWPLTRVATDGTTSTVDAMLVTPQPLASTVVAHHSTSLMFQFAIATGGTVTFGHGTVTVSIGVGDLPATSFTASAHGGGDVVNAPTITGPYASALASIMPAAGTTGLQLAVDVRLTGGWVEVGGSIDSDGQSLSVCAPVEVTSSTASGNQGFADVLAESGHGDAPGFLFGPVSLCITDFGDHEEVRLRLSRVGSAESTTFSPLFGTQPVLFWNVVRGTLPARVYDSQNGVLDLDALAGTRDLPLVAVERIGADPANLWYVGFVRGQVTFSFVGHP